MNATISTNGHNKASSIESVEILESASQLEQSSEPQQQEQQSSSKKSKAKRKGGGNNKAVTWNLDIDAGANRVKSNLNGSYKSFPSQAKFIKGDVPLKINGAFNYGSKSYVAGAGIDRVNGQLIVASQDSKLSHLDIWIIGSLTHYRKQLKEVVKSKRRPNEPAKINLNLRVVTLSSMKRKELDKVLKQISSFTWEDVDFEIEVKNIEFLEEGQGAAEFIARQHDLETFHLFDLGGGTSTGTTYDWDGDELSIISRTPISGGGMQSVINKIFKALTRVDRGSIQAENPDIQEALELSKVTEESNYFVPLRSNGKVEDIADEVEGALSEWISGNYALVKMFDLLSQKLARGERVFCTGGGCAIPVVAHWLIKYLSADIDNPQIEVLPEPQHINLTGLNQK